MSEDPTLPREDTGFDRVLAFSLPNRHARGRVVRLGPVLETVLSAHAYPPVVKHLLAEALVMTSLMGSLLKEEGAQLTIQAQAEGGLVDMMVCDYRDGEVRGYVHFDAEKFADMQDEELQLDLPALFGTGYLAITFDLAATKKRYQGVVPLEGASLADACEAYFAQSEQVPTLLRISVRSNGERCMAGGLLMQFLPDGEEGQARLHAQEDHPDWEHVSVMAGSVQRDELLDPVLTLEELLWRLFHEEDEVRVEPLVLLQRGCRCTVEHYKTILSRFPEDQLADMREEDGTIPVDCAFCSKVLNIPV
ncbi:MULTISPECIES: Hsp33 family molecular chaperone HslO [Novosphingobium]|uniref:Hsp33 family molecular chaperone HslO n=2 Tax=Novosphingobium TaxID=165696 RepID=A0ABT0AIF1_9SPHN|nr:MULTISPECIES: Hsp33 family molecular chaperone HslO [Novosphingobium]MCJ1962977.1 Hsp33 family molecular chaperone HslO [Novosphingobium mangrovi (ex Hu et al. 2023)]QVM84930.1 Hsp33 family molecular chaperone HslO [Novosphingobium decolorationis]GAM03946.1 molecular chaperone Hsp33 [Novosphingobium sp. MBES04]